MTTDQQIAQFLSAEAFAVAGASTNRDKFGNKVLRCYLEHGRTVVPVNPRADEIEGIPCVASVAELPPEVTSLSVVTPPAITVDVVRQAIAHGVTHIWLQPGAENPEAITLCREAKIDCIAGGPCLLVSLGFSNRN